MADTVKSQGYHFSDEDRAKAKARREENKRLLASLRPLPQQIQPLPPSQTTLTNTSQPGLSKIKALIMDLVEIKAMRDFLQDKPMQQVQQSQNQDIKESLSFFKELDGIIQKRVDAALDSLPDEEPEEEENPLEAMFMSKFNEALNPNGKKKLTDEEIIMLFPQIPTGIRKAIKAGDITKEEVKELLKSRGIDDAELFERAYTLFMQHG